MGSSQSTLISTSSLINELKDVSYQNSLSNGRFLKCIKCFKLKDGQIIVKLFIKSSQIQISNQISNLESQFLLLKDCLNCFPYHQLIQSEKAVYLIRQYFIYNLYGIFNLHRSHQYSSILEYIRKEMDLLSNIIRYQQRSFLQRILILTTELSW